MKYWRKYSGYVFELLEEETSNKKTLITSESMLYEKGRGPLASSLSRYLAASSANGGGGCD
jgi:hypothetical protein